MAKSLISIDEARARILSEAHPLSTERRELADALGFVLAEEIAASHSVPPFDNSAMDGYAVVASDTTGASWETPVRLRLGETIPAGHPATHAVEAGWVAKIMTGAPMPPGSDAVVEVESTQQVDDRIMIFREVRPRTNVRRAGEDVAQGDVVLRRGDVMGPAEIGVTASLGYARVLVHRKPAVAIISTGSELAELDAPLKPGQIRNSNSYALEALCRQMGANAIRLGIAVDDRGATRKMIEQGLEYDVLLTSGGVSVGEFDFVKEVQDELGVERRLWGVAMKPGKPLAFGVKDDTLVFGLPGNPVSAMVSFELFVKPALLRLMGHRKVVRPLYRAVLEESVGPIDGRVHVVRVRAWREGERWHVSSTGPQGSGILRSMVHANGLAFVPISSEGLRAGEEVDLLVLREDLLPG